MLVLGFEEIQESDARRVGGKAASLATLAAGGFPVPEGFVITTAALELVFDDDALGEGAAAVLERARRGDGFDEAQLAALRERLRETPLPEALVAQAGAAWARRFAEATPLAVRSSGTKEDLEGASFAGQYETVLGVRGWHALERAIRHCWASMWQPRVLEYALTRGGGLEDLSMAVVVQRMIPAEVAGVLFTVNPLSGREEECLIEAAFGLGEALVSGRVNADRFVVDPRDGRVLRGEIAEKGLRVVALPDGSGTREERLVGEAAKAPTLDEAAIAELAEIGAAIQEQYGRPMDVEWVREGGRFYVVQARPVTSISFAPEIGEWTTADFKDGGVAADVCAPFMWSLYRAPFQHSMPTYLKRVHMIEPQLEATWIRMFFARPYWNLGEVRRAVEALPDYVERKFDTDLGIAPSYEGDGRVTGFTVEATLHALPVLFAVPRGFDECLAHARGFVARFDGFKAPWELGDEELQRLGTSEFARAWRALVSEAFFETESSYFTTIYNTSNSKTFFNGAFERARKALGGELDYLSLVSGLEDLSHMRPLYEMHEIAAIYARERRALDEETVLAFARRWRHHGRRELDIREPRWGEEPQLVRAMLEQAIASFEQASDPREQTRAARRVYEKERERALAALPWWARGGFKKGLERVRAFAWWREEMRDKSSYMYYLVRRWSLEAARRLVARGWLEQPDDVWYLEAENALDLMDARLHPADARELVRAGRRLVRSFRNFKNPPEIGQRYALERPAPEGALVGTGGSPGRVEGRARVLAGLHEMHKLEPGDVLVTAFTDPGWTPLFARLSAVVTETGGVLAHAAVISREYGIPAVLAVPAATQRVPDGARVIVDGTSGTVEVLQD